MIKIHLDKNFSNTKEISDLYKMLAKNVGMRANAQEVQIICTYKGIDKILDTEEEILDFLLAKDFYEYKFEINREIFDYAFLKSKQRHMLLSLMGQRVCPYCNMNYVYSYNDGEAERTLADLDHFYLKSVYPEYSLCLYNFVPACPVCNSRLKLTNKMNREEFIFPHEDSFEGKAKFQIVNLDAIILDGVYPILELDIYNDIERRVTRSESVFKTNAIYAQQVPVVNELIEKARQYTQSQVKELSEMGVLNISCPEVKEMIFGKNMTEEDIANISLGKLKRDILKQLGIY